MLLYLYVTLALFGIGTSAPYPSTAPRPKSVAQITNTTNTTLNAASRKDFLVKNLPDVNFTLPRSYAGEMPLPNKPGNNLFFWFFETEKRGGSENLIVWFNGGPGCSSLIGLGQENGPIRLLAPATGPMPNNYSWTKAANVMWVENPINVGFSYGDNYASSEYGLAQDFTGFLHNFYKVFPELSAKKLSILSESFGGFFAPYITKEILNHTTFHKDDYLPSDLVVGGMSIGDATIAGYTANFLDPLIPYLLEGNNSAYLVPNKTSLNYFQQRYNDCGFSFNITYPPTGHVKPNDTLDALEPDDVYKMAAMANRASMEKYNTVQNIRDKYTRAYKMGKLMTNLRKNPPTPKLARRDSPVFTPDPAYYGCQLDNELYDYVINFTNPVFDVYYIPDRSNYSDDPLTDYLSRSDVRQALNVPSYVQNWTQCTNNQIFASDYNFTDPYTFTEAFIPTIASVTQVHLLSGTDDWLVPHQGTELTIQNTTWNGKQGFQRPITRQWSVPKSEGGNDPPAAGKIHSERNITYTLFLGAGHEIPEYTPAASLYWLKTYFLGGKKVIN